MRTLAGFAILVAPLISAQSGMLHGTVASGGQDIPFRFELEGTADAVKGTFFNGDERFTSTSGRLADGSLSLKWEYFAATLEAKVENGAIDGTYSRARSAPMHFHAVKAPGRTATGQV